jgi:hypothetical protein
VGFSLYWGGEKSSPGMNELSPYFPGMNWGPGGARSAPIAEIAVIARDRRDREARGRKKQFASPERRIVNQ